jgi:LCP family protein required for cell wall assembly
MVPPPAAAPLIAPVATLPPPSQPAAYHEPLPVRPRRNWAVVALALVALLSTLMFGAVALVGVRMAAATQGATNPLGSDSGSGSVVATDAPLPTFAMPTVAVGTQIEPWDGQERFTVLLMGLDKRPGDNGTAFRTDSLILVSIDPTTRSVGMLSIPRDLYVEIPPNTIVGNAYGLQRVNSAYVIGELVQVGAGPQLAMQTVQYNLGMRVNDYVAYDFSVVIDAINMVGGLDINVTEAINDPAYPDMSYGYDPLFIPAGPIHMDGALALKYARSRHGSSDVVRARRQQEVLLAVRERVLNVNMLPDLLTQAPNLWNSLSRNVKTGLTLDQLLRLAVYLKDIPRENIRQAVIDYRYVTGTMWDGASVLVPDRAALGPLMVELFGPTYNQ